VPLDYVANHAIDHSFDVALSNSFASRHQRHAHHAALTE